MQVRSGCDLEDNNNTTLLCFSHSKRDASDKVEKKSRFCGVCVKPTDSRRSFILQDLVSTSKNISACYHCCSHRSFVSAEQKLILRF